MYTELSRHDALILEQADEALQEALAVRERVNASLRRSMFEPERRHPNRHSTESDERERNR